MVTSGTNYTKKYIRGRGLDSRNDKVVIVDPAYNNEIIYYRCEGCRLNIGVRPSNNQQEIVCSKCGEVIAISKARRKSKLETPHKNTETLVSTTQTPGFGDVKIKHEPELQGGFLALSQKGLKIKDYSEDIPS